MSSNISISDLWIYILTVYSDASSAKGFKYELDPVGNNKRFAFLNKNGVIIKTMDQGTVIDKKLVTTKEEADLYMMGFFKIEKTQEYCYRINEEEENK
jgi:hypothetical protein